MKGRLAAALVVVLVSAGCLGGAKDPVDASATEGAACPDVCPQEATDERNATAATPASTANGTREPVTTPFAYDGATAAGVCPPAPGTRGVSHCVLVGSGSGSPPELAPGTPLTLNATLTATDGLPAGEFYASLLVDVGDGWTWDPEREPGARGAAPLAVEWDLSAYPQGTRFQFYVDASESVGPVGLAMPREYHVEGEVTGSAGP